MDLAQILQQPIPDHSEARMLKQGYREYPLDESSPRNSEPLVDVAEYGLAGQSYYSRPNAATGDAVPGVNRAILVRKSIAERLGAINYALQASKIVTDLLGAKIELYIDEGVRLPAVQARLHSEVFPNLIRTQHPEMSETEVFKLRDQMVAKPPETNSPTPHGSGAAVDLKMRFIQPSNDFVPKVMVDMGHAVAGVGSVSHPDYFEHLDKLNAADKIARRNRRIFYWVMRGALTDEDSGFAVNPTEWWHWSYGDQMWAKTTQAPKAFFGFPPEL